MILSPLIGQSPLVGGVTMFFIRRPVGNILLNLHKSLLQKLLTRFIHLNFQTMHLNWTGMTNLLDSPALRYAPFNIALLMGNMLVQQVALAPPNSGVPGPVLDSGWLMLSLYTCFYRFSGFLLPKIVFVG